MASLIGRRCPRLISSRPPTETNYVEPQTALEKAIAAVWCDVLKLDRVGIHDDFLALGGDSLLAAGLIARLSQLIGAGNADESGTARLPMSTIVDFPTVEALARRLSSHGRGAARPTLRKLKQGAAREPMLFLVHDGNGETLLYMNLVRRLPTA